MFCLPKPLADTFTSALKDGTINPEKLAVMASEERATFFEKIVGKDNAHEVNALFESKLLLKDYKSGLVSWAKKVAGMSETARRDLISRIEKMDRILNPTEEKAFLADLVEQKLGTRVTVEEAKQIAELSRLLSEAKANLTEANRLDYGAKNVALQNYVNELKLSNSKTTLKGVVQDLKTSPIATTIEGASKLAGIAKGVKASLDDSAIFRQGWKTVFTNPQIWAKNAMDSFANIYKQLKIKTADDSVLNAVKADVYSRENAVNGLQAKAKLDVGNMEEAFPTTIPERIPIFGRLYKASQVAYTAFLYRMRADIFDKYIKIAKENGVDLTDTLQVESIGRLVNSLTGRGSLGSFEVVGKQVNTIFFSPKMVKSSFDFLTLHAADKMSSFARKQAALNLLKVASGMALILGTAKALDPDSVDFDPRSANFGKIRIGDTRFDISGGMSSMITLAARMVTQSSKSSTSGKVTPLNSGKFGAQTTGDVFVNYFSNKLSPAFSVIKDIATQSTFGGEKPTLGGEAVNLLAPLPITNAIEIWNNPKGANPLLVMIADALGISANTYSPKK